MKTKPTFDFELNANNMGYNFVIGVDEAGRGGLALGVVAAAVHITDGFDTSDIRDSKKLSSKKREELYNKITKDCNYAISYVDEKVIDEINILNATKLAMNRCICKLEDVDFVLIDGNFYIDYLNVPQQPIINGDNLSASIAAASILAKHYRDTVVMEYHKKLPI